ncbi:MAG TPA: ABC transporter permease [Gemmatimonadales bacterium]|nr:ABC transporter permease [Gemmatimonadales bacterium]
MTVPGERLYRALLHLYPAPFRHRYGAGMLAFYRDRRAAAGPGIWPRLLFDLIANAFAERVRCLVRALRPAPRPAAERITMSTLLQDLRLTLRGLVRTKGFTAVVLLTLALGIGANAAIFSVVNGVLLRPLPFADPGMLVNLQHRSPYSNVSEPEFHDYRRDMRTLERLAAYADYGANLSGDQEPVRITGARVSDGFFAVLGVAPLMGRTYAPDEERPSQAPSPVIVISETAWRTWFGADPKILTREVRLNGIPRHVIGVMPAAFAFPDPKTAVWLPLRLNYDSLWTRNNHYMLMVGRLRPGATAAEANTEANLLTRRWIKDFPETYFPDQPLVADVEPLKDVVLNHSRPYLLTLLGAVAFVLLIACANVANLLLIRGEARRREFGIRTALGASSNRLVTQQLTESSVLALAGGALGVLVAWGGVGALVGLAPASLPRLEQVHLDAPVLLFTLAISVGTGLLFGLLPALRAARGDAVGALKDGARGASSRGGNRVRRGLIMGEVALAVVMLSGAGLLVRSLRSLQQTDIGFDDAGILTARINLPPLNYPDDAKAVAFVDQLEERIRALPGVTGVTMMGSTTGTGSGGTWSILIDGRVVKEIAQAPSADPQQISPGFFKTLGVRMLRGRAFTGQDRADAPPVAVINEAMARQLWPGQDPLGHTLKMFNPQSPWVTVVGVTGDMRSSGIQRATPPTMFFPLSQAGRTAYYLPRQLTLAVKTTGRPDALSTPVTRLVHELDPGAPVSEVRTLEEVMGSSLTSRRFTTLLLGWFAGLALLLAGIGIYGVIAYGVSQRTYEIGLRQALGADRGSVMALIVGEGLRLTGVGLVVGLVATLATGRLITSLLVNVTATDPATLLAVAALLGAVALVASWIPARRAMAVNPTEALRGGG